VKREVLAKDRYEHSGKIEWRDHKNGAEEDNGDGQIDVVRTPGLPKFIVCPNSDFPLILDGPAVNS
jgi:hypothetical protein